MEHDLRWICDLDHHAAPWHQAVKPGSKSYHSRTQEYINPYSRKQINPCRAFGSRFRFRGPQNLKSKP